MEKRRMGWALGVVFGAILAVNGAMAEPAKMFGTLTDEAGAGVPDGKVFLVPVAEGERVEGVAKGQKGSYLFEHIRPGRYAVKVVAERLALVHIKGDATVANGSQPKTSKWTLDARVRADRATEIQVEDGMEITCDLIVGAASEITTTTGEKMLVTPDQAYTLLAQQVSKGDCAGALPQLEKFNVDNPANARAFYLKGFCDAVLEKDADAIVALMKSQELDPTFAGTSTLMGKVHAGKKRLPEAEAAFKKELENTTISEAIRIDALLSLGAVQRDQAKDADAIATFEAAMAAAPKRPEPYLELSALYAKAGQTDKATAILDQAKAAGAEDPRALLSVGIAYFNKKDDAHAESMFRRVTESKSGNTDLAMAFGLLGKVQQRDGKNADAIESFKKSLELDPVGRLSQDAKDSLKALQASKKK